jgi:mannose-6-phosphate isomerase-like protein (cupin superfamily)
MCPSEPGQNLIFRAGCGKSEEKIPKMAKLFKFREIPVVAQAFDIVKYRQFFDTDGLGPVDESVYKRGSKRYEEGYSVCRIAEAKPAKRRTKNIVQPDHFHPQRFPFTIIGISGRRTMVVNDRKFVITPGTILQIEKGERHRTIDLGKAEYVTLELWQSAPHDDEILITKDGELSVMKTMVSERK